MSEETAIVEETTQEEVTPAVVVEPMEDIFSAEPVKEGEKSPTPELEIKTEETTKEETTEKTEATEETEKKEEEKAEGEPTSDDFKKRYEDATTYAGKVANENVRIKQALDEQARQNEILKKKLNGEWTEEDEEAESQPKVEDIAQQAHLAGKMAASIQAAFDKYGREEVEKTVFADDGTFAKIKDFPAVKAQVLSSDAPVLEIMKLAEATEFFVRWGYDRKTIEANMEKHYKAKLTEEITKKVMDNLNKKKQVNVGINEVRGSDNQAPAVTGHVPLKDIFG